MFYDLPVHFTRSLFNATLFRARSLIVFKAYKVSFSAYVTFSIHASRLRRHTSKRKVFIWSVETFK